MLIFHRKIFISFFFLIVFARLVSAVNPDTASIGKLQDTSHVNRFAEREFFCTDSYSSPDSLLDNFQRYFPKNSLGNPGTALTPLLLPHITPNAGFDYWLNHFQYYLFKKENIEYYRTRSPYTNVYLATGTKEEQYFQARHSQNINRNLNMAVGFVKLRSQGDYLRQAGNNTNVFYSTNYFSRDGKYFLLGNILYNNLRVQENGGIVNDSIFEAAGFSDKKLIEVNLSSAQRRIWNKGVYLKQGIVYGRGKDTIRQDSLGRSTYSKGTIWHSISLEDNSIVYLDSEPDPLFYESIFIDSAETRDSIYFWKIENELAWTMNRKRGEMCRPRIQFSIAHQLVRLKQIEIDSAMQNMIAKAEYNGLFKRLNWNASGEYAFAGDQSGDLRTIAGVKYVLRDSTSFLGLFGSFSSKNPEFIYNRYSSNHYMWSNDWNKYRTAATTLSFTSRKLKFSIGVSALNFTDPLYFDVKGRPKQYAGAINAYSAFVKKNFRLGKWVLANTVRYQHIPDSTVIRFPEVVSENAIYYENSLFKGALRIQAGIDIFYTSSFMGNAYTPVTAQYHIQNDKEIGNYPFVDLFVNLKIKTVRAFLKYEHANAGFIGNTYYLVPHYPLFDASFVLGLSWDFYN